MQFSVNPSRLRHSVELLQRSLTPDENGETGDFMVLGHMWCECQDKSMTENQNAGRVSTSQVITALTWSNDVVKHSHYLRFNNEVYRVTSIQRDNIGRAMIITAEVNDRD